MHRRWKSRFCHRSCSTSRHTPNRRLQRKGKCSMIKSTIEAISLSGSTISMQTRRWIRRKMRRRKCQGWGETIWRGQQWSTLPSPIAISRRKRFVEIVKTKISPQDISARYVRCPSNWWNCLILTIEGLRYQLSTIKKLLIRSLCSLIKLKSAISKRKTLTHFTQFTTK